MMFKVIPRMAKPVRFKAIEMNTLEHPSCFVDSANKLFIIYKKWLANKFILGPTIFDFF
jgi:hypothetical protein